LQAEISQSLTKGCRQHSDTASYPLDTDRAMPNCVHACHDGQQNLRRANIGGRLFAPDMLFTGLQRKTQRGLALAILGYADQTSRQIALIGIAASHKARMRAAKTERHAK